MTEQPPVEMDRTEPVDLNTEMQRSYIEYAMSVIVSRALPDVRDGLKPVHGRIVYAMYAGGERAPATGRARRHQAGAPPHRLRDVRRRLPPRPRLQQVRARRRRRDGPL